MKLGLATVGSGGLMGIANEAREAEAAGFDFFITPSIYGHDPISLMTVAGLQTSKIRLMTGIVPTYPRHPAAMASSAVSAGVASGGRFILGIGLSHRVVIEGSFGMSFDRPAVHMREYLDVLQPLLEGKTIDHTGEQYTYRGAIRARDLVPVPTMIAAMAPVMLRIAGERTAGTILWMTGAKAIREHVAPRINRAAADVGRPAPEVVTMLPVALTNDPRAARDQAQQQFENYGRLPSYRAMLDKSGAEGPGDAALVGDEAALRAALLELNEAGTTSFGAWTYDDGAGSPGRTREFLASLAPEL